jgi:hypothetical protein
LSENYRQHVAARFGRGTECGHQVAWMFLFAVHVRTSSAADMVHFAPRFVALSWRIICLLVPSHRTAERTGKSRETARSRSLCVC